MQATSTKLFQTVAEVFYGNPTVEALSYGAALAPGLPGVFTLTPTGSGFDPLFSKINVSAFDTLNNVPLTWTIEISGTTLTITFYNALAPTPTVVLPTAFAITIDVLSP